MEPARESSVLQSKKLKGAGDLKSALTSDIKIEFGAGLAGFQSCFGPVFPYYTPFPMLWNNNVYPVP